MNAKIILSLVTLGIIAISSLGNVSAGEVGLWLSKTNNVGEHGSYNRISIEEAIGHTSDGRDIILNNDYDDRNIGRITRSIKFQCAENVKITSVRFRFNVYRTSGITKCYTRQVYPEVTFPVENGWVCGVTETSNSIGMYFTADNHYPKANECKMDTVHCFMDSKEVYYCPGGKYHEEQTWRVVYTNGKNWT